MAPQARLFGEVARPAHSALPTWCSSVDFRRKFAGCSGSIGTDVYRTVNFMNRIKSDLGDVILDPFAQK
ncbi:UNVERIFIED_CONTAM: hypothetical protein K2H54_034344 [Gekko kuhli]